MTQFFNRLGRRRKMALALGSINVRPLSRLMVAESRLNGYQKVEAGLQYTCQFHRFVLLVERGHEADFEAYLEIEGLVVDCWLDGPPGDEAAHGQRVDLLRARRLAVVTGLSEITTELTQVAAVGPQRLRRDAPLVAQVVEKALDGVFVGAHRTSTTAVPSPRSAIHSSSASSARDERASRRSRFLRNPGGASGNRPKAALVGW